MRVRVRVCVCVCVCVRMCGQKFGTLHRPLPEALEKKKGAPEAPACIVIQVSDHACGGTTCGRGLESFHFGYTEGQDSGCVNG